MPGPWDRVSRSEQPPLRPSAGCGPPRTCKSPSRQPGRPRSPQCGSGSHSTRSRPQSRGRPRLLRTSSPRGLIRAEHKPAGSRARARARARDRPRDRPQQLSGSTQCAIRAGPGVPRPSGAAPATEAAFPRGSDPAPTPRTQHASEESRAALTRGPGRPLPRGSARDHNTILRPGQDQDPDPAPLTKQAFHSGWMRHLGATGDAHATERRSASPLCSP